MGVGFEHPVWLWALLLAPACAVIGWTGFRSMSAARRAVSILLRAVLIIVVVGMLAGVNAVRTTHRLAVVALVDVSESVRVFVPPGAGSDGVVRPALERVRQFLRETAGSRGDEDLLGIVLFDGQRVTVSTPRPGLGRGEASPGADPVIDRPWDVSPDPNSRNATDIASAIRHAAALFPPDANRRILLISDGNQTEGDAVAAAQSVARDTRIDVVPLRYQVLREVVLESVSAPTRAAPGTTITVSVVLRSTSPTSGTLRFFREGVAVNIADRDSPPGDLGRRVALSPGTNIVLLSVPLPPGRVHRFTAIYEPDGGVGGPDSGDTVATNNRGDAFTMTPSAGRVLIVDGVSDADPAGSGSILAQTLRDADIDVAVVSPAGLPADLLELQQNDLIVLQNVPAGAVPIEAQNNLVRFVNDFGGGLVMIGGPDSFGAGGWRGSAIEPILPVALDLPERLVKPTAALVIVMDTSGSMAAPVMGSQRSQQDISNEGAAIAVRSLDRTDLVGVIEFNSVTRTLVPLQRNENPDAVARTILAMSPGGGTNMPPALREAQRMLRNADAQVKHVVVLSDGESVGRDRLPGIAREMRAEGITVSTIAVGDAADRAIMAEIAALGGGAFYTVDNPTILPRIFLRAVSVIRTPMIREVPFVPQLVASGSPLTAGLSGELPPLRGLTLTSPRAVDERGRRAGVTYAMLTPDGEPVLAHWQVGLGQVAAFTSDAHDRWAVDWLRWPGYRQLWTQAARILARPQGTRAADLNVSIRGQTMSVRLELSGDEGRPLDDLLVAGAVFGPDGQSRDIRLSQDGPGSYAVQLPVNLAGNYILTLRPMRLDGTTLPPIVGGAVAPAGAETRSLQSDDALLAEVAEVTGGRVLDLNNPRFALFDRAGFEPRRARLPLWPDLLGWAIVIVLLDVASRRVAWDRLISRRYGGGLFSDVDLPRLGETAARTLGRLRQAAPPTEARPVAGWTGGAAAPGDAVSARQRSTPAERTGQTPTAPTRPTPSVPATPPDVEAPRPGESPLMAAKRRARERMENSQ